MITESTIVAGPAELGLRPTFYLMIHASLSKFGHVNSGAATVMAALQTVTGNDGAVVIPSFRDPIRSDHYALGDGREGCPQSLRSTREHGFTGIIGETVRQQPDVLRCCHPTYSWVGGGSGSRELLEGHHNSPTPCGRDSPSSA